MQPDEKGTQKDLIFYRIETAQSDIKAAEILLNAKEFRGANNLFFSRKRMPIIARPWISSWRLRSRPCHRYWRSAIPLLSSACWKRTTDFPFFPIWLWSGISGKEELPFYMWRMWRYPCTGRFFTIRISLRRERWRSLSAWQQSESLCL